MCVRASLGARLAGQVVACMVGASPRPLRGHTGDRMGGQPPGCGPLSRPSESRPWSREVGLDDWRPDAGPPARPVPARPAHGSPRLPAAYRRLALTELMAIWSFRPTPGRIRAHWARPGPAGSSVASRSADPPKCRSHRAERGSVVGEGWLREIALLGAMRCRAPGAWANLVLLLIHAHHSDHRSTMMVSAKSQSPTSEEHPRIAPQRCWTTPGPRSTAR